MEIQSLEYKTPIETALKEAGLMVDKIDKKGKKIVITVTKFTSKEEELIVTDKKTGFDKESCHKT